MHENYILEYIREFKLELDEINKRAFGISDEISGEDKIKYQKNNLYMSLTTIYLLKNKIKSNKLKDIIETILIKNIQLYPDYINAKSINLVITDKDNNYKILGNPEHVQYISYDNFIKIINLLDNLCIATNIYNLLNIIHLTLSDLQKRN